MAKTDIEDHWGIVASGLLGGAVLALLLWLFRTAKRETIPGGIFPIPTPVTPLPKPIPGPTPLPLPEPTPVVPLPLPEPTPVLPLPYPPIELIPPQLIPLPPPERPKELGEPSQSELPFYPVPELPPITIPLLPEPERERYLPPIEVYPPPQLVPQPTMGDISLPGTMLGLTAEELAAMLGGVYQPTEPLPPGAIPVPSFVIEDGTDWGLLPFPGFGFINPPALPGILPAPSPGMVPVFP